MNKLSKELPRKLSYIIQNGETIIYQNYHKMKLSIIELVNQDTTLTSKRKTDLINQFIGFRKVNKLANESIIHTEHLQVLVKLNKIFMEDDMQFISENSNKILNNVTHVISQDKEYMDNKRSLMYKKIIEFIKKDQELSDLMMKELILKLEQYYSHTTPSVKPSSVHSPTSVAKSTAITAS